MSWMTGLVMAGCLLGLPLLAVGVEGDAKNVRVEKDVDYLGDGGKLKADIYYPAKMEEGKTYPGVVIIHGGGWEIGDKASKREVNIGETLASNGYVAMSINYVLYNKADKKTTWPTNLHQCKTAVRWMRVNAKKLGVDGEHIGVIGGSAGGNLSTLVGFTEAKDGLDPKGPYGEVSCRVQAVVDMYGPADLLTWHDVGFLGKTREEAPELYRQSSLLPYADKNDPPILILHGTADKIVNVQQSMDFAEGLKKIGVNYELIIIPDAPHTFDLQPAQKDLRPAVVGFFDKYLKVPEKVGKEGVRVEKDVDYLGDGGKLKADLYFPATMEKDKLYPGVVIIHGGGWTIGDKASKREVNIGETLASNGYVALSINYVLYDKVENKPTWPTNLHQCKTAVRWLRMNARKLGVDGEHIGVIGGSAGGNLATLVGFTEAKDGLDPKGPYGEVSCRVQAVVDMYGPADMLKRGKDHGMFGKTLAEAPELYRQASLAPYADKDDPPILILHGTGDTVVDVQQSKDFAAHLEKIGARYELVIVPDAPHTFDLQPEQKDLRPTVVGFFDRYLKVKK